MGRRLERQAAQSAQKPPQKYAQLQHADRDGPPLGDVVASTIIFRFSPEWTLQIIGVEDHDPRKSEKRFVSGVHSPFCFCLPGGRQQTNMKSGEKETPHFVARKEAQEEAGIPLPFNEIFPVLTARRVGWRESGRDHFDKERPRFDKEHPSAPQVIHFNHFIFVCYGEDISPGTPREKNIKNPAWHPIEKVLGNPLWSFDHVTLIIAALKVLGDLCARWSHGEWAPEASYGAKEEESLGALFFERLATPLQKSSEALATITRYAKIDLLREVARRMKDTRESRESSAEWYLGIKKQQGMGKVEKLQAEVRGLKSEIDRIKDLISRIEKDPERTLEEAEKEVGKESGALKVKERALAVKESELRQKKQEHPGRFVADSFRAIESRETYIEALCNITEEQEFRA